jgi:Fucose 4-O-acetylase and related acetyltransferases
MENKLVSKNRITWVDTGKGIAIILIVMCHTNSNVIIDRWLAAFTVQLFFFLSGMFARGYRPIELFKKRWRVILIPYFSFAFITYLYWFFIERHLRPSIVNPLQPFINIFIARGGVENYIYNVPLWYLPCFFISEIIFSGLLYYFTNNNKRYAFPILLWLSSIIGYGLYTFESPQLPWFLNVVPTTIVFIGLGYYYRNSGIKWLEEKTWKQTLTMILLFILTTISAIFVTVRVNLITNTMPPYFVFYAISIAGILLIIMISNRIHLKWLEFCGKNSLIIMCIHEPIKRVIIKITSLLLNYDIDLLRENFIAVIALTGLVVSITIPIILFFNRFVPTLIGKSK